MVWSHQIILVVLLCLVLAGTAAASHIHHEQKVDVHCQLCDLAATFVAVAAVGLALLCLAMADRVAVAIPVRIYEHRRVDAFCIRPPPKR